MKKFKATYSTESLKNIEYDFFAKNMNQAKKFRKYKFSAKRVKITEIND